MTAEIRDARRVEIPEGMQVFGKPIARLGGNLEIISRARIEINAMRLAVLQAAKAMDVLGNKEARVYVSTVKAMVPERVCLIIDQAIQMHGATGISQWTPLADLYTDMRHLRFANGPDESITWSSAAPRSRSTAFGRDGRSTRR